MVDVVALLMESGVGAVVGVITGYLAKVVAKVIVVIIGIEVALFKFLETKGVITVDWGALASTAGNATDEASRRASQGAGYLDAFLSVVPVGAGFIAGAAVGWKIG